MAQLLKFSFYFRMRFEVGAIIRATTYKQTAKPAIQITKQFLSKFTQKLFKMRFELSTFRFELCGERFQIAWNESAGSKCSTDQK